MSLRKHLDHRRLSHSHYDYCQWFLEWVQALAGMATYYPPRRDVAKTCKRLALLSFCGGFHTSFTPPPLSQLPPGQDGRNFADDIFRCIFVNETFCILIEMSLKFVHKGPIYNKWTLAWPARRQAITWTNADPVHWRIYAALGGN